MSSKSPNLPVNIDLQSILEGISKLDNNALEAFAERVDTIIAQRKATHLSKEEARIIERINEGVPSDILLRYSELLQKSADETLSEVENQEFLSMIPIIEAKNVERLELLIELAQLKGKSVDDIMFEMGIKPAEHV